MIIDLHVDADRHLKNGTLPVDEARRAAELGFDGVVFALRGALFSREDLRRIEALSGIKAFRAQITSCKEGELLIIGHDTVLPDGLSALELKASFLRESGACRILILSGTGPETDRLAVKYMYRSLDTFDLFDGLEIYASGLSKKRMRDYLEDKRKAGFCAVGGSASETPGLYCSKFYRPIADEKDMASEIIAGRVYPCPIEGHSIDPRGGRRASVAWNIGRTSMIKTKGLIFDLYGTLIDLKSSEGIGEFQKLAMWLSGFDVQVSGDVLMRYYRQRCSELYASARKEVKFPEVDILHVMRDAITLFSGKECPIEFARKASLVFRAISVKSISLYPNVRKILRELRRRGYTMGIISNAQAAFTVPEIEDLRLWQFFDFVILSSDVGCSKPEEKIYDIALRQLELPPEKTAFIGDDLYGDIHGAAKKGCRTVFVRTNVGNITSPEKVIPDAELTDGDLRNLLRIFP